MIKPEVIIIGTITKDEILFRDTSKISFGGAPFFAAAIFEKEEIPYGIVSKVGKDFKSKLSNFRFASIKGLKFVNRTTELKIEETKKDVSADVKNFSGKLKISDIPEEYFTAKIFLISTLSHEVSIDMIKEIRSKFKGLIALDIQGFTRPKIKGKEVHLSDFIKKQPEDWEKLVKHVDILKCNELELNLLVPGASVTKKIREVATRGPKVIVCTLGGKGSLVFAKNKLVHFKSKSLNSIDTVGAGDKFFTLFLSHFMRTNNPFLSAKLATQEIVNHLHGI